MAKTKICIVPHYRADGPLTFTNNLITGLEKRGIDVTHELDDLNIDSILVISATRELLNLQRQKKRGVRIVQRLGSPSLLAAYLPLRWRNYALDIVRNYMVRWVRSKLADSIVYQSKFVKHDWERIYGVPATYCEIIYNSVDTAKFGNVEQIYQSPRKYCLISVEGQQGFDPFDIVINLGKKLESKGVDFEFLMLGIPMFEINKRVEDYPFINFIGSVPHSHLPYYYSGANAYVLTDIVGAGCPNSVLEALSCGTPVLAYDVGVISEMLNRNSGILAKSNGDPWKKQSPGNFNSLAENAMKIFLDEERFRKGAMNIVKERYDLDQMVEKYIRVLLP